MLNLEEQIFKQINKSKEILIVLPLEKNGGTVSAGLALYLFLKKLNKKVDIASSSKNKINDKNNWSFLPAINELNENLKNLRKFIISLNIKNSKVKQIKYTLEKDKLNFIISPEKDWFKPSDVNSYPGGFKYDLIITIDTSDLESLGEIYDNNVEFFYKTTIINIDKSSANEEYGQINYIDLNISSSSEILYYLFKNKNKKLIDEDIATCLLAAIIFDTKNFKVKKLSPRTLLTSSELIDLGAKREEIVNHLYRSRSIRTLKLWGKLLNNLKEEDDKKIIWSKLNPDDFTTAKASENDVFEIIDELMLNLNDSYVLAIFYQVEKDKASQLIIQTSKNVNAKKLTNYNNIIGDSKRVLIKLEKNPNSNEEKSIINNLKLELAKMTNLGI